MKISVITVTYNAENWIEGTILSILNQSTPDFEYLIIDGKSKDGTLDIIKKYEQKIINREYASISIENFHWISEPDKGLYDAMNKGIALAVGDFLWFINAGDKINDVDTIGRIVAKLSDHPCSDVIYGQTSIIDSNDNILGDRHKLAPENFTKKDLLHGLVVCHQSILVRRSIAPNYDLKYRISADYDWVCKVMEKTSGNVFLNECISRFMMAGLSSDNLAKSWRERFFIMSKHFGLFRTLLSHVSIVVHFALNKSKYYQFKNKNI